MRSWREDAALEEELVVGLEGVEQAWASEFGTWGMFLGSSGGARRGPCRAGRRLDAVLDAVQAGHQLRGEGEGTGCPRRPARGTRCAWPWGWSR